jgi:hypothetical protein
MKTMMESVVELSDKVQELVDAANAVWGDAAEGGTEDTAIVSGYNIRRLALAQVALMPDGPCKEEMRIYAEQWPEEEPCG